MKKIGDFICKNKNLIIIISCILLVFSFIGMKLTKVNYDILVYLPQDIETIKGQDILTNDFNMGAYSITVIDNMNSKDILSLEDDIKNVEGVEKVVSLYDVIGTSIPIDILPNEIVEKVHEGNSDLLLITFKNSTSNEETLNAVSEIRKITDENVNQGGMSSMVLDTMNLSNKEITIYIIIAVILCIIVLELSLDSYIVPFLLLINIGFSIMFNLGTNIFLGQISYITKALVAVLQLGVTTDFSIFLYHSYEKEKESNPSNVAMVNAIKSTFISVIGSSLTTIVGFLALCAMQLTLGKDLGIVMAKGVLLGVVTVLTLFPSLLLSFDSLIEKTKHKKIVPDFSKINKFIIEHHVLIFICFIVLLLPIYKANEKVKVYYKLDSSLPNTLESVKTNNILKEKFNIVSPEIILINRNIKNDDVINMINDIKGEDGIDFVLSFAEIKNMGITEEMLSDDLKNVFLSDKYQALLVNSTYDIATDELNNQINIVNNIVKKYDKDAIIAGEGPLMKDLIEISDTDFKNVNNYSNICIFIVLLFVLKSISLPFLLIIAIEMAIFTNMSVSYFGGSILPFIAPIVLGTIQLGATIDYAILMTSTYLEKRKNNVPKKEAMLDTLNYCGTSIITSGMCFFAATFGVGLYSKIEMIGALCTLISRGALISVFVVITVLPSILLIFDKLIIMTTLKDKEKKKMKKIKKAVAYTMLFSVLVSSCPVSALALSKQETVYSKLNYDGSVKTVLVNEQLINDDKLNEIKDYSTLNDILNVNNSNEYTKDGDKLVWNANGKDIFYQGTTDKKLPVSAHITYKLNGEVKELDEILGKSGKVTIEIKYKNSDKHGSLYTPFVVTTGMVISNKNNSNVNVTNGKCVNNGNKIVIVGISSPGLYESLNLSELKGFDKVTITYDTESFELASIYSVITPKLIESSDLKVFKKLDSIYENVDELQNNMNKIEEGANKLSSGSTLLKNKLYSSINNMSSDGNALSNEQINYIKNKSLNTIRSIYTDEYKNNIATTAWNTVKAGMENSDDNTVENIVKTSISKAVVEYLNSVSEYEDYKNCEIGKVYKEKTGSMTDDQIASCIVIQNDKVLPLIQRASLTAASDTAENATSYIAEKVAKEVAVSVSENTALKVASQISSSVAGNVANSVKDESVKKIKSSLDELYSGVSSLDDGIQDLKTGINAFNEQGINKITSAISNNVKGLTNKISSLIKLSNNYKSFAGSNTKNTNTKFIMVIDSKKEITEVNTNIKENTKESFFDRVKNLFK